MLNRENSDWLAYDLLPSAFFDTDAKSSAQFNSWQLCLSSRFLVTLTSEKC